MWVKDQQVVGSMAVSEALVLLHPVLLMRSTPLPAHPHGYSSGPDLFAAPDLFVFYFMAEPRSFTLKPRLQQLQQQLPLVHCLMNNLLQPTPGTLLPPLKLIFILQPIYAYR